MIDVHTHLHPPRLFAAIRRWFAERSSWVLEHPTEPADVARALREAGVERFVFCSYAHKPGIARDLNVWLCATSRELGGYGLPLATVHLDDPDPLGDLRDALADGAIGIKIHEDVQRLQIDDIRWRALFDELAAREAFVLVHVGRVPWSPDTQNGPARVGAVLNRHPKLRVVVAHFGRPDSSHYIAAAAAAPGLFLDTTMAFAQGSPMRAPADPAEIERASGFIVYGTDYPNIPYPYLREREALQALGLSEAARARIYRDNVRRLSPALD